MSTYSTSSVISKSCRKRFRVMNDHNHEWWLFYNRVISWPYPPVVKHGNGTCPLWFDHFPSYNSPFPSRGPSHVWWHRRVIPCNSINHHYTAPLYHHRCEPLLTMINHVYPFLSIIKYWYPLSTMIYRLTIVNHYLPSLSITHHY